LGKTRKEVNDYQREYMARRRDSAQEIGEIPSVVDPIRRSDCQNDFQLYCRTYHAAEFTKPWAPYQKRMAERIQSAVEEGGWRAEAVPRGGGKTTLCCCGVEWAALRGTHFYVTIFGASEGLAVRLLKSIKTQLFTNELLLQDFPHTLYPIWKLGNEARRASGQKWSGVPTFIEWSASRIVLPWIDHEDSCANGVVIESFGLTGALRGLKHTRPDGTTVRPDIGLLDDVQTRESAKSPSQTQSRLETITGDIAYLAGPGQPMPIFCPCTIIYENDLADQLLDRDKHPEWQGEKVRMVESFPKNITLWDEYADVLRSSYRDDGDPEAPNKFYLERREKMDEGAEVSWEHRFREDEISAIQHAMNLRIRNEAAFYAECQNEPIVAQDDLELLSADAIARKVSGYERRVVPDDCSVVTAFTDVQKEHLFWMVCAWQPDFTGYVIDYGAWPDQRRHYFTRREIRNKISGNYAGDEGAMTFAALKDLEAVLTEPYKTKEGRVLKLSRWCIDGNWRSRANAVVSYARQSDLSSIITVTQGRGVKATENPFSQAQRAMKWKSSHGAWFWQDGPGAARWVTFDANHWKTSIHQALALPQQSKGSLTLFKAPFQIHQMLGDHLRAEKPQRVVSKGRTVYEWVDRPGQDNEGLDCLVGCALAASISGIMRDSERAFAPKRRQLAPLDQIQKRAAQKVK
jgi:hypothetical protein